MSEHLIVDYPSGAPLVVVVPAELWGRIVFAAQESDDWRLKTLLEQAVMEAKIKPASE